MVSQKDVLAIFDQINETDKSYLNTHLSRFINTFNRFDSNWDRNRGNRVLDIGAHWLHQSIVFKLGGYDIVAADLPTTLEMDGVKKLAEANDIKLVSYSDLSVPNSLSDISSNSIDVVLLSEIIEHITFNPVELWKEIYRVITPEGRVVLTTPNFYWMQGNAWKLGRFLKGFGAGITVLDIINTNTIGHHWKEYSLKELQQYFCILSPDFNCVRHEFTSDEEVKSSFLQKHIRWLRQGLHLEVDLFEKKHGIVAKSGW